MTTMQHIQSALNIVLETKITELTLETSFDDDLDLDSVQFVQFLLTLEDSINGLLFDPDLISQSEFNDVGSLIDFIESQVSPMDN